MRARLTIGFCLLFAASAALAANTDNLSPTKVFALASPSIVVVEALDQGGKALYQGSGVVIHKGVVVSNCHVFTHDHVNTAIVRYRKKTYSASLRYADVGHDLCSFNVKGLPAPPIRLGSTSGLKVGEKAYAIGTPEGLDLSLSGGLISSLRHVPDGTVIQMTTPISPGSSGGGLFDSHARLIGITSYYMKEGEQLNFAVPVEWIKVLPHQGKSAKELAKRSFDAEIQFHKGTQALLSGDFTTAIAIFTPLAKGGNARAQDRLGLLYYASPSTPSTVNKALYWYHKAAQQGDVDAQESLGMMYRIGVRIPEDDSKVAYWFREAAAQGSADAQLRIGRMYETGMGVSQDYTKALYWYHKAAKQHNTSAKNNLGTMYRSGLGVPQDNNEAVRWFRDAAEQGDRIGQFNLATMYVNGYGVTQSYVQAAKWFIIDAAQADKLTDRLLHSKHKDAPLTPMQLANFFTNEEKFSKKARKVLLWLEKKMTPNQIAKAQRLAREWQAKHHKQ